jgi:hypothetical protein
MADIRAGDEISAGYWPPAVMAEDGTDLDNVSSTTAIPGSPEVGVGFISPTTGRIGVCVQGGIDADSAEDRLFISYEVYEGTSASGTLVRDSRAGHGISSTGGVASDELFHGNMSMVSGLTPEVDHYARIVYWTEGVTATNDVTYRRIIVFPLP